MTSTTADMAQTKVKKVNIFINDRKHSVDSAALTGAQLKALASIAGANQLFLETPGPEDDLPIRDDDEIKLKSGMRFYDVPVGNLGAR